MDDSHTDRRSVRRRPGDTLGPVSLRAEPGGQAFVARVRDISIRGIGLLADCTLTPGTPLSVQAVGPGNELSLELKAEVRHAPRLPEGPWLLGCSFSRHLTADDMLALG